MMTDLIWILRSSFRLWGCGTRLDRNALAWLGLALQLASLLLFAGTVAGWGIFAGGPVFRILEFIGTFMLFSAGATAVCFGSHFPRSPQTSAGLPGAELLSVDGPPDAPGGLLVIISGYGSESPALCEPESLRQAWSGAPFTNPLLRHYRKRLFLHLHGGIGWNYEPVPVISAGLDALLQRDEFKACAQNRPNLVIGHSRGCQVAAGTATFRNPGWRRIAVHPPFGVQFLLRLFAVIDPGISEIHQFGLRMADRAAATDAVSPATFPWDRILQARGFDHTVWRHAPDSTLPLENRSLFGSHITPFTGEQAPVWGELRNPQPQSQGASI